MQATLSALALYGNDECKWEMFCLQFSVWEARHIQCVSLLPSFWHQWDFTAASGSLWVFAWTLFSFALLCAMLRSQVNQGAAVFTPAFAVRNEMKLQLEAGGTHSFIAFIRSMYEQWPVHWADYKEASTNSETSQEYHWSQTDAFKYTLLFTVTAVSVLALSRKFTEISFPLLLNCCFYMTPT